MASTYVNDLRLEEMATGDQSGTWGDTTNTNLELIAEAFSYGTQASFGSDADATTTIADGASDPARSLYLKITSGVDLTATRTLTIAPNTVSKIWIIENATSGSQSINISQGSGANVTIPNGDVKVVYSDGAGSGAAVVDAFTDLNTSGTLTATNLAGTLTTAAQPNITSLGTLTGLTTTGDINFGDNDKAIFGADSDLQIYHASGESYVEDVGAGDLSLRTNGNRVLIATTVGETMGRFEANSYVKLYYDNAEKLATTSTGIDVTGTATMDGLTVDGNTKLNGSFTVNGNVDTSASLGEVLQLSQTDSLGGFLWSVDRATNTYKNMTYHANVHKFLSDATTEAMRITSSGNVGIGVIPSYPLHVGTSGAGIKGFFSNTTDADLTFNLSSGVSLVTPTTGILAFGTASTERMRIDSSGNVGIGTSSPNQKLNVSGGRSYFGANSEAYAIGVGYNGTRTAANQTYFIGATDATAPDLQFSNSDGGEKVRITHAGNVGIGTTSPSSALDVNGTVTADELIIDATQWIKFDSANTFFSSAALGLIIQTPSGNENTIFRNSAGTERMRIDSSGNLIMTAGGTIRAGGANDLVLDAGESGTPDIYLQSGGATKVKIEGSNGNVGIGIASPSRKVSIFDSYDGYNLELSQTSAYNSGLQSGIVFSALYNAGGSVTDLASIRGGKENTTNENFAGNLRFYTRANGGTDTERMRINSSGDVLIGTTNTDPTFNRSDGICLSQQDAIFCRSGASWDLGRNSTSGIHISFYTDNGSARVSAGNISSNGSTTSYNTSSDARLKDVTGEARGLEVINELNPVAYNWKADGKADEGLIAQEVQEIVPNAVSGSEEDMYQMDYSKLVVHLVAGMKEQQAQIEALQSEINLLKGE